MKNKVIHLFSAICRGVINFTRNYLVGAHLASVILILYVYRYVYNIYIYYIIRFFYTPLKTNMTMENPPFEDVFPIEHGYFPMSC